MKRVYVLVEGPSDAAFLRRILPREVLTDAELVPAGGRSAIASSGPFPGRSSQDAHCGGHRFGLFEA